MLIELEGAAPHEEDTWIGGAVEIGSAVVSITKPDARCAITTQNPDTGERDLDTLRTLIRYRGFRAGDPEKKIDFGVLGEVLTPGRSVGDEVSRVGPAIDPGPIVRSRCPRELGSPRRDSMTPHAITGNRSSPTPVRRGLVRPLGP